MGNAYVSKRSGNWNVVSTDPTSPWYDNATQTGWASVPSASNGDTVSTLAAHTITVPAGYSASCGSSPATGGTAALAALGPMVINGRLDCWGDYTTNHASGTLMPGGAGLYLNIPAGTTYSIKNGVSYNTPSPLFCNGTTGAHVTIQANLLGAGAVGLIGQNLNSSGCMTATFTDILNFGTSSQKAIDMNYSDSANPRTFSLTSCTLTNCGLVSLSNMPSNATCIIDYNKFTGSLNAAPLSIGTSGAVGTGVRRITHNSFDKRIAFVPRDFTVEDNYFEDLYSATGYANAQATGIGPASFRRNFCGKTQGNGSSVSSYFSWRDCYYFANDSAVVNPHGIDPVNINEDQVWTGNVFDANCADNQGDILLLNTGTMTNPYTLTCTGNLWLPSPTADCIGTPITAYGNAKLTIT